MASLNIDLIAKLKSGEIFFIQKKNMIFAIKIMFNLTFACNLQEM
jgi:hypothetical protein